MNRKVGDLNPTTLIVTLNIQGLNTPNKTQILSDSTKKQNPTIRRWQEMHFKYEYRNTAGVRSDQQEHPGNQSAG